MTDTPTTPDSTEEAQSPNDTLATQIAVALVEAGLITDNHKTQLLNKLRAGCVSQEDWNLWIDLATAPQAIDEELNDE